ncbi:molybdenum cofactor guanylyltransferase [Candidatus Pseudothioglobus singularis]|uniref:molybdenum cofactor guanylyltransferase MobA n=1 Tax=Candidatus Pseudothioglobus singularis TaxID=1427364 RepID=UPI000379E247|nr:molybdenum cofactor guanylyltransferase MobA [Candidatus Pseudothioglobus singularis]MDG1956050.1 molybdenum cofactor guanylyltransferase MobA [Candidatus Thioglobus sp.]ANQ66843.1 molybdenum cofactor guanylyltransferase [Candidatus Pseudothioglobus singularis]MDA7441398.1 molybdenum cofactor guanylyltransferase [Candidatus Pseudothioglobus singularis]MDA9031183.1 molybdenum cofactor guanylyltransferase [Candidatus Pseudothioglobus singularis]MDB4846933.1 molybdenum cofactor guanylyltransfe
MKKILKNEISVVILAGGRASRMGGKDKGLIELDGAPLIAYVHEVVKNKASHIFISANRNTEQYSLYGEVIIDDLKDFQGPLAGISKALKSCETKYLLVLPCDSPYIDSKLIDDMIAAMSLSDSDICVAHDGSIMHATFALMKSNLSTSLDKFLDSGGRKMALWYRQQNTKRVDVSNHLEVLTNLNSPEDF